MHETVAQGRALAGEVAAAAIPPQVDVVVCPPFTALEAVAGVVRGTRVGLGAQNMHEATEGAFTGEISAPMLCELGVGWVILGHSERREYFCETDAAVARKVRTALQFGLVPIVAVGETEREHAEGRTVERVVSQIRAALDGLTPSDVAGCVVAYEPIWAIGTGNVDSPASANSVMGKIRAAVPGLDAARILYGGSMKPGNAAALMAESNIDGGLIGGASLSAEPFLAIVDAARAS
jgi:triosephosphate isomerase